MPVAFVAASEKTGTTTSLTSTAAAAGHTFILWIVSQRSPAARTVSSIGSHTNVTWTKLNNQTSGVIDVEIWYGVVAGGTSGTTGTITMSGTSSVLAWTCREFSGVLTAAQVDGTAVGASGTTSSGPSILNQPTTGTYTAGFGNDLILAAVGYANGTAPTINPGGFTNCTFVANSTTCGVQGNYIAGGASGANSATWAIGASTAWSCCIGGLKVLPAGTPTFTAGNAAFEGGVMRGRVLSASLHTFAATTSRQVNKLLVAVTAVFAGILTRGKTFSASLTTFASTISRQISKLLGGSTATYSQSGSGLHNFIGFSGGAHQYAISFVPPSSGFLATVTFQLDSDAASVTAEIRPDGSGVPGISANKLASFTQVNLPPASFGVITYDFNAGYNLWLTAGVKYWVVLSDPLTAGTSSSLDARFTGTPTSTQLQGQDGSWTADTSDVVFFVVTFFTPSTLATFASVLIAARTKAKALSASLATFGAVMTRQVNKILGANTMQFDATVTKQTQKTLAATMAAFAGAIFRGRQIAASMAAFSATITKQVQIPLLATMALFSAAIMRGRILTASMQTFTATLTRKTVKGSFDAGMALFTVVFTAVKGATVAFTASMQTFSATITKLISKIFNAS